MVRLKCSNVKKKGYLKSLLDFTGITFNVKLYSYQICEIVRERYQQSDAKFEGIHKKSDVFVDLKGILQMHKCSGIWYVIFSERPSSL